MLTALIIFASVLFLFVGVPALVVWGTYNGIIERKNAVKRAWADVLAFEREKIKLIPALEAGIQKYQEFENTLLTNVTKIRASLKELTDGNVDVNELINLESQTQSLMRGLNVAFEAYPAIRSAELYTKWMRELSELEENIAAAIRVFNSNIEDFNNGIQMWPNSVINRRFNREATLNTFIDEAVKDIEFQPNF